MQAQQSITNIEEFHRITLTDSNIITIEDLKQTLEGNPGFDKEEMKKPYREIDFLKAARSVNYQFIPAVWTQRAGKGQSKSAISTYEMKKGHVFGVGSSCNKSNNLLLIKNINSQWCSHAFAFGDESQKKQLNENLSDIYEQDISVSDMRNLSKMTMNFNVCNETSDLQSEETMEQLKYITLLKEIMTIQLGLAHDPKQQIPQHVGDGIIKTKYDEKQSSDITKFQLTASVLKIKEASWIDPLTIINVNKADEPFNPDQSLDVKLLNDFKSVNAIMKQLQNRNLDVIVQLDNANIKKDGKRLIIIPKMKIVQVIVKGAGSNNTKSFGLNLSKFMNTSQCSV